MEKTNVLDANWVQKKKLMKALLSTIISVPRRIPRVLVAE